MWKIGKWLIFLIPQAKTLMGRSAIWCGSGCQRFLIGFCLSQVEIGDKTKLTELNVEVLELTYTSIYI